jgi:hypothetical protein
MNAADLSKLFDQAIDAFELACSRKKKDPGAYRRARERLADVSSASDLWRWRAELSTRIEADAAMLRALDENVQFLLTRQGAQAGRAPRPLHVVRR